MLYSAYRAIRSLLFAQECMICGEHVDDAMHGVCIKCRFDIPLTNYWLKEENPVKEKFAGVVPIEQGSSFIFYAGDSLWRTMVHRFKYSGEWQIAFNMGRWYGAELKASGLYDDVDVIIPIPLHPFKLLKRGYNQSTYLAEGMAKAMGIGVDTRAARRIRNNPSQARRGARDRWENVDELFRIVRPERLQGKHILVVDDVLTSGATLTTFLKEIMRTVPECRISIATLAVTKHITPLGR